MKFPALFLLLAIAAQAQQPLTKTDLIGNLESVTDTLAIAKAFAEPSTRVMPSPVILISRVEAHVSWFTTAIATIA